MDKHYMFDWFNKALEGDITSMLRLGSLWFFFFTTKFLIELRAIEKWPSVVGDLHDLKAFRIKFTTMKVNYSFVINGVKYAGKSLAHVAFGPSLGNYSPIKNLMEKVERPEDGKVVIFYNPKKPFKNLLLKPGKLEYSLVFIFYAAALFLLFVEPISG